MVASEDRGTRFATIYIEKNPGGYLRVTRREMIEMGVVALEGVFLSACGQFNTPTSDLQPLLAPHLLARAGVPPKSVATVGYSAPYSRGSQDSLLYVPTTYNPLAPAPLLLMLAAEGRSAASGLNLFQPYADAAGLIILGIEPAGPTWDWLLGSEQYGPDVVFISNALAATFNECNVNPARVSIGGFSDGASYALTVGRTNGTLFSKVMAFSPTAVLPDEAAGKPSVFLSKGSNDPTTIFTFQGTMYSDALRAGGYAVESVVFDGGHELPPDVVQQAAAWLLH